MYWREVDDATVLHIDGRLRVIPSAQTYNALCVSAQIPYPTDVERRDQNADLVHKAPRGIPSGRALPDEARLVKFAQRPEIFLVDNTAADPQQLCLRQLPSQVDFFTRKRLDFTKVQVLSDAEAVRFPLGPPVGDDPLVPPIEKAQTGFRFLMSAADGGGVTTTYLVIDKMLRKLSARHAGLARDAAETTVEVTEGMPVRVGPDLPENGGSAENENEIVVQSTEDEKFYLLDVFGGTRLRREIGAAVLARLNVEGQFRRASTSGLPVGPPVV